MNKQKLPLPQIYKGIALFTPGGDLIYTIDPKKQNRWHLHLCLALQQRLNLSEPPHFLVPAYTATIDRWRSPITKEIQTTAEVYPAIQRYIPLLQVLFNYEKWQVASWQEEYCNPNLIEVHREFFPQLWQENELILSLDSNNLHNINKNLSRIESVGSIEPSIKAVSQNTGYVLRLFISHDSLDIKRTLSSIHQVLEHGLNKPYTLKIIDIHKNPEQAERDRISATPALVRVFPEPVKKIVGELNDLDRVLKIISS